MARNKGNLIGGWAFLIGVILAVILGAIGKVDGVVATILVLIGLIVGVLNIADEETTPFLMSGAVLIIAGGLGGGQLASVPLVDSILQALLTIFVPATIIVAIKNVFNLAHR